MFSAILFSERVRFLRESHNLSLSQLADILGKNKSAIAEIEAGRVGATLEALSNIADLFAVSIDWLLGRTENPYTLDIIQKFEKEHQNLYHKTSQSNNKNLIYYKAAITLYLTEDYFMYSSKYKLEDRANVIYALNFCKYAANKLDTEGYDSQRIYLETALREVEQKDDSEQSNGLISNIIELLSGTRSSKRAGTAFAKLCYQCLHILDLARQQISHAANLYWMDNKPSKD